MKGKQTEPPEAKAEEPKSKANPSKKNPGEQKTTKETAFPVEADLEEGLGNAKDRFFRETRCTWPQWKRGIRRRKKRGETAFCAGQ